MTHPTAQAGYTIGSGSSSTAPFITVFNNRNPLTTDIQYPISQRWYNTVANTEWFLTSFSSTGGVVAANWSLLATGTAAIDTINSQPPTSSNFDILGTPPIDVSSVPGVITISSTGVNTINGFGASLGNFELVPGTNVNFTAGATGTLTINSTGGGGGSVTITGDSGTATGSTISFSGGNSPNTVFTNNGTINFSATGSAVSFGVTDASSNTVVGATTGAVFAPGGSRNNSIFGYGYSSVLSGAEWNCIFGYQCASNLQGGFENIIIGAECADSLTNGHSNILIGSINFSAGTTNAGSYTSTESGNIIINNSGITGESGVIRIGTQGVGSQGHQNSTYIAGITGATPVSANVPQVTLCDNAGNLTTINSGTATWVLTSNGAATPTFQPASGGGGGVTQTIGAWIPTLAGASTAGTTTYSVQQGNYIKTGSLVHVDGFLSILSATGTGNAIIGGLPFTINSTNAPLGNIIMTAPWVYPVGTTALNAYGIVGQTQFSIEASATGTAFVLVQMQNAAATFYFSMSYQT